MINFVLFIMPIIAMIWFAMTIGIIKKIVRRDENLHEVIVRDTWIASILFGVIIFSIVLVIIISSEF